MAIRYRACIANRTVQEETYHANYETIDFRVGRHMLPSATIVPGRGKMNAAKEWINQDLTCAGGADVRSA